jgi:hypothetical protein
MSVEVPILNGQSNGSHQNQDHNLNTGLTTLSLSSKTIHADDFLNIGPDVAPPLHVSTTFRYNNNPDALIPAVDHKVNTFRTPSRVGGISQLIKLIL